MQQHFKRKRTLASGISYCGINLCFLTIGPIIRMLLNVFGWHGVVMLHAAAMLHIQIFAFTFKAPANALATKITRIAVDNVSTRRVAVCKQETQVLRMSKMAQNTDNGAVKVTEDRISESEDHSCNTRRPRNLSHNCVVCEDSN